MILGLGTDLVSVARLADMLDRHGGRFRNRCFRDQEFEGLAGYAGGRTAGAAAGWAAKEAFLKALGTRVTGIPYRQIEVQAGPCAPPCLVLHDLAKGALEQAGAVRASVTLSRAGDFAVATVILEGP